MPSEHEELWVWNSLAGGASSEPVLCGRFQWTAIPGGTSLGRFVYARAYLERALASPIDPVVLPLKDSEFTTTALGGIFSALHDAAPDSWGRHLIERLYGPQNELGFLLRAAGERSGTLEFSAARDVAPERRRALADLDELAQAARLVRSAEKGGEIPKALAHLLACGTSNGGARPKFAVWHRGELWLAKLPSGTDSMDLPSMPLRECAALTLAARCGIEVPEHRLIDAGGIPALLVRRFDRRGQERFACASARTVAWSNPEVMRYSYMPSYPVVSRELGRWIRNPEKDRLALYERIVFNAVTGNGDDHDANHALVLDRPEYGYRLAPLFDPVPSSAIPARELAMAFGDDGRRISTQNLLSRSRSFGLEHEQATAILTRIGATVAGDWRAPLRDLGAPREQIDRLAPFFVFARELARPSGKRRGRHSGKNLPSR